MRMSTSGPSASQTEGYANGSSNSSSDKPWIIASTLVFVPAFLYLVSPSARQPQKRHSNSNAHDVALDKCKPYDAESGAVAKSASTSDTETEPVLMKDDEGKEEDVSASLRKAEQEDVPRAGSVTRAAESVSTEALLSTSVPKGDLGEDGNDAPASGQVDPESKTEEKGGKPKNMGSARQAAVERNPPKNSEAKLS